MLVCALPTTIAHGTAGAACTRFSLRPLVSEGGKSNANLGRIAPRDQLACLEAVIASAAKQSTFLFARRHGLLRCARNDVDGLAIARMERSEIRDGGSTTQWPRIALRSIRLRISFAMMECDKQKPRPVGGPDGALMSGKAPLRLTRTIRSGDLNPNRSPERCGGCAARPARSGRSPRCSGKSFDHSSAARRNR